MNIDEKEAYWQEKICIKQIYSLIYLMSEMKCNSFCQEFKSLQDENLKFVVCFDNYSENNKKILQISGYRFKRIKIILDQKYGVRISINLDDFILTLNPRFEYNKFSDNYFLYPEDLIKDISFDYYSEENTEIKWESTNSFSLTNQSETSSFIISEKGILNIGNPQTWLLSKDMNRILSLKDEIIPNLNIIESFDKEEEAKKVNELLSQTHDLHPFTISCIKDNLYKELEKKQGSKELIEVYYKKKLPIYREVISSYLETITNLPKNIFDENDLKQVINVLSNHLGYDEHKVVTAIVKKFHN